MTETIERKYFEKSRNQILRMKCGVQLADGASTKELMVRLELGCTIVEEVKQRSLRWLGHDVKTRDEDCVKHARRFEVEASKGKGRPRLA